MGPATRPAPSGLPRLGTGLATLGGADRRGGELAAHVQRWGELVTPPRGRLAAAATAAGLTGRGGARFPTGVKLAAVAAELASRPDVSPVLLANGMEGEPASQKDAVLLGRIPHLVIDGLLAAAAELGALRAVIAVKATSPALPALRTAVGQRRGRVRLEVVTPPLPFVASQEKSLLRWLGGGPAKPTLSPPHPAQSGLGGAPTFAANVETLAHLALLARYGPDWFRSVGTAKQTGSWLVTVRGAVAQPGVHELAGGASAADVLAAVGGPTMPLSGVLLGGYFGQWAAPDQLAATPGLVGAGVLLAVPAERCPLLETAAIAGWLAAQSAGQCGPCTFGLPAVAASAARLAAGQLDPAGLTTLQRWLRELPGRGACHHPDGASGLVASALAAFPQEVTAHLHGQCRGLSATQLAPLPASRRLRWR